MERHWWQEFRLGNFDLEVSVRLYLSLCFGWLFYVSRRSGILSITTPIAEVEIFYSRIPGGAEEA